MKSGSGISGVNWQERPHYRILHPTGFAQKVGQSDPLPPAAAVPLCKGDNKPSDINECILPLEKGESRVAAGGRSARLFVQSLLHPFRGVRICVTEARPMALIPAPQKRPGAQGSGSGSLDRTTHMHRFP